MGRSPCCSEAGVKKGPWMPEEDKKLVDYISKHGQGNWRQLPKLAGLNRCGKSCRLRWTNYLRPDIKRGSFSKEEEQLIIHLHSVLGNKWSMIAARLQGRTDNEIKNHWNTHLRKKLLQIGIDPVTHRPRTDLNLLASLAALPNLLQADASYLARLQLLQGLLQTIATSPPNMDVMSHFGLGSAFANHQFNEFQQLNQMISNNSVGIEDPTAMASGFSAFRDLPNNFQAFTEQSHSLDVECSVEHGVESNGGSRNASDRNNPSPNYAPSLISASPEADQAPGLINSNATSVPPYGGGLNLDNLDDDLSWKDILEEISWSDDL